MTIKRVILVLGILYAAARLRSLACAMAGGDSPGDPWLTAATSEDPTISQARDRLNSRVAALLSTFDI